MLDEAVVGATPDENLRWTRAIVDAADARDESLGTLGARERFQIVVARRDGSELVPLFTGCSPNMTAEERERARANDGKGERFFGNDSESRQKAARDAFKASLGRALVQVQKRTSELAAEPPRPDGLVRALQNAGQIIDLSRGFPRLILVSPFLAAHRERYADVPAARKAGFALAEKSRIDLSRAEVFIAGAQLGDQARLEFTRAFLLGSAGLLTGTRSDGLPALGREPASVRVYAGFVDYVGQRVPMQLRLSVSSQGDLVNSWLEAVVSKGVPVATPIGGKMFCRAGACEVRGDGTFARVWLADPHSEPSDRSEFPFGAVRQIEMVAKDDSVTGRIQELGRVKFVNPQTGSTTDEIRLDLQRLTDGQF